VIETLPAFLTKLPLRSSVCHQDTRLTSKTATVFPLVVSRTSMKPVILVLRETLVCKSAMQV